MLNREQFEKDLHATYADHLAQLEKSVEDWKRIIANTQKRIDEIIKWIADNHFTAPNSVVDSLEDYAISGLKGKMERDAVRQKEVEESLAICQSKQQEADQPRFVLIKAHKSWNEAKLTQEVTVDFYNYSSPFDFGKKAWLIIRDGGIPMVIGAPDYYGNDIQNEFYEELLNHLEVKAVLERK